MTTRGGVATLALLGMTFLAGCSDMVDKLSPDPKASATPAALAKIPPAAAATQAAAPAIDFGDDAGKFAKDGECDDRRFSGPGMTDTPLIDEDIKHDATDCRTAFEQGKLSLAGADSEPQAAAMPPAAIAAPGGTRPSPEEVQRIQWGDDNGEFAKDGECDDMRFSGPGMTETTLLDSDIKHDATDCRKAFEQGRLSIAD